MGDQTENRSERFRFSAVKCGIGNYPMYYAHTARRLNGLEEPPRELVIRVLKATVLCSTIFGESSEISVENFASAIGRNVVRVQRICITVSDGFAP
ncbi:hypothetical protein U1Q18_050012 [Sarracenia purpurea var. burkii]